MFEGKREPNKTVFPFPSMTPIGPGGYGGAVLSQL